MAERHILWLFTSLFLLIELGLGLKAEGLGWHSLPPSLYKEPCVSLLATDLEPYLSKLLTMPTFLQHFMLLTTFRDWHIYSEESKCKGVDSTEGESTVFISICFNLLSSNHRRNKQQ